MKRGEGDLFTNRTAALGVDEVRFDHSGGVLVYLRHEATEEQLDAVRLLAKSVWPEKSIFVLRRTSVRESGMQRMIEAALGMRATRSGAGNDAS